MRAAAASRWGARPATVPSMLDQIERMLPWIVLSAVILLLVAIILGFVEVLRVVSGSQ